MKIEQFKNSKGNAVKNQFIIRNKSVSENQCAFDEVYFQSYNSIIVKKTFGNHNEKTYLDEVHWDYSKTTGKYRNQFLGETKAETEKKIKNGEYTLTNLN